MPLDAAQTGLTVLLATNVAKFRREMSEAAGSVEGFGGRTVNTIGRINAASKAIQAASLAAGAAMVWGLSAGLAAGKPMWMIGDPKVLVQRGFTFLCIAEPSALLETTLRQLAVQLRAGTVNAVAATGEPLP